MFFSPVYKVVPCYLKPSRVLLMLENLTILSFSATCDVLFFERGKRIVISIH
jgi:hypothetical protein